MHVRAIGHSDAHACMISMGNAVCIPAIQSRILYGAYRLQVHRPRKVCPAASAAGLLFDSGATRPFWQCLQGPG